MSLGRSTTKSHPMLIPPTPTPAPARTPRWTTWLAPDDDQPPQLAPRVWVFPLVFIPWLILYESIVGRGPAPDAFETYFLGERHWPVYQWTELLYFSPYVLVTLAPFVITTNRVLRRFTLVGILGTVIGHLAFLTVPAMATPR